MGLRGRKPGKPKTGGRVKGTPNHRTLLNQAILDLKKKDGVDFWPTVVRIAIKNANEHKDSTLLKQLCNSLVPPQMEVAGTGDQAPTSVTVTFGGNG